MDNDDIKTFDQPDDEPMENIDEQPVEESVVEPVEEVVEETVEEKVEEVIEQPAPQPVVQPAPPPPVVQQPVVQTPVAPQPVAQKQPVKGKGAGIASFIIGLISICWPLLIVFIGWISAKLDWDNGMIVCAIMTVATTFINIILGTVGICLAAASKKQGYTSGIRSAGFALSLISLILGALTLLSCLACLACTGLAAKDLYSDALQTIENMYSDTVDSTLDHALGVLIYR